MISAATPVGAAQEQPPRAPVVRNFPPEIYRANRQNWAVAQDSRGIHYFGNTSGVLEFDGSFWRVITMANGRGAYALARGRDGRIFVGGEGDLGFLAPDDDGVMRNVSLTAKLPGALRSFPGRIIQILPLRDEVMFLSDAFLLLWNGSRFRVLRPEGNFLNAAYHADSLYVLDTARGLTRLTGGVIESVPGGEFVRGLTMASIDGGLLIPTPGEGLVVYSKGAAQEFRSLAQGAMVRDVICSIALRGDLVALGTAKQGVVVIDASGREVLRVSTPQGLVDPHVYGIGHAGNAEVWLALDGGLALLGLSLPGTAAAVPFQALMRSVQSTKDDRVFFGGAFFETKDGVQQLTQGGSQIPKFPFDYNAFRFAYSASGLEAGGSLQFQTLIPGVDRDWSSWSDRTEREVTMLPAGDWMLRVRARNQRGEISGEGAFSLRILKAWYDTLWFAAVQVVFVLGLLILPGFFGGTKGGKLQDGLTTFAILVPFTYLSSAIGPWIGQYSKGIVFFKVLMSSSISFLLNPLKKRVTKRVEQFHGYLAWRKSKR
jgi:hypothetical protein